MDRFTILRKKFLDRPFSPTDFAAAGDLFRRWYLLRYPKAAARTQLLVSLDIYQFPTAPSPQADAICRLLARLFPPDAIDTHDPEWFRVSLPHQPITTAPDLSALGPLLNAPEAAELCLRVSFSIRGRMGHLPFAGGQSTLIFCGQIIAPHLLLKTIWHDDGSARLRSIHPYSGWREEFSFLTALTEFQRIPPDAPHDAAVLVIGHFGVFNIGPLFQSRLSASLRGLIAGTLAELPGERRLPAFLKRLATLLLPAIFLVALSFTALSPTAASWCLDAAYVLFALTFLILFVRARRIWKFYSVMRTGLGKLYAGPVIHSPAPPPEPLDITLKKCTAEILARRGFLVSDIAAQSASQNTSSHRYFALGDFHIALGSLHATRNLFYFPPHATIIITTRFRDGGRHVTINRPKYSKPRKPNITLACVPQRVSFSSLLDIHRRCIQNLPPHAPVQPPVTTPAALAALLNEDSAGAAEIWKRSPYSWADALHEAFGIPRNPQHP